MAILKLIGANRFMNKKANPNVIEKGGLTQDIKDQNLVSHLLSLTWRDTLNNSHSMFEVVAAPEVEVFDDTVSTASEPDTATKEEVQTPTKQPAKKAPTRKKGTRTRNKSAA